MTHPVYVDISGQKCKGFLNGGNYRLTHCMKLQNTKNSHNTNTPGESHDFQIGDPGMVIEILRNRLYKNPIRTLVQEYICNARDAVREAGEPDHRIKVTAPTAHNPVFSVRDFGNGIDPDRMVNVFIRYGASTKRDSNKQTGGFGIGAKSAWAYADQFTIITRIDGVQRQYLAHIAGKNNGQLEFVSECETSEENGTEIQVPVRAHDIENFHSAIQRTVMFWDERPTLIDLKEEKWFAMKPLLNQDGVIAMPREFIGDSSGWRVWDSSERFVIVDGIPYDGGSLGVREININDAFVGVRCNTGDVDVSANREGLSQNTENETAVKAVVEKANESLQKMKIAQAENASDLKSYVDSLAFWYKISGDVEGIKPRYGITLDDNGYLTFNGKTLQGFKWGEDRGRMRCKENAYITISELSSFPLMILVDSDMAASARTFQVKQAMLTAGKKTAFGLLNSEEIADLEIIDFRLSELKASRRKGVRNLNGSTRQPTSQVYNLQTWRGYDGFSNNFVDFSTLASNTTRYVYCDLKTESGLMNSYQNFLRDIPVKLVGVGTLAKKAIDRVKSKHPMKFLSIEEVIAKPTILGGDYAKIVDKVCKDSLYRTEDKNLSAFVSFSKLKGIERSVERLKDTDFRREFARMIPVARTADSCYLPQKLADFVMENEKNLAKDLKLMKMLGELLISKMPFITMISDYRFEQKHGDSLIDTLNVLIEQEAK